VPRNPVTITRSLAMTYAWVSSIGNGILCGDSKVRPSSKPHARAWAWIPSGSCMSSPAAWAIQ
jgi:hypothetical protein